MSAVDLSASGAGDLVGALACTGFAGEQAPLRAKEYECRDDKTGRGGDGSTANDHIGGK